MKPKLPHHPCNVDDDSDDDDDLFRKGRFTEINNPYFTAAAQEKLIEKKRLEMTVNTNLTSILSCRCSHCSITNNILLICLSLM